MGQGQHVPVKLYLGAIGPTTLITGTMDITGFGMDAQTEDYLAEDSPNGVREFTTVGHSLRDASGQCLFTNDNWDKLSESRAGADDQDINAVIGRGSNQRKLVLKGKVTSFNLAVAGSDKVGKIDFTLRFNPQSGKSTSGDQIELAAMA